MNTHNAVMKFGKHSGQLLTRVPISYLNWGVAVGAEGPVELKDGTTVKFFEAARAEIERRGERIQNVEVSGHAIDRISQRHRKKWHETKKEGEGLYTWAQRMTLEALDSVKEYGEDDLDDGKLTVEYKGMKLVIIMNQVIPTLLTAK